MQNPILSQLNSRAANVSPRFPATTPDVSGAVDLYKAYRFAKNPMGALRQMAQQNPAIAQLQKMQAGGADMRQTFFQLCQQQGVDPQSILSQFEA